MSLLLLLSQHSHFNLCHTQRCLRNSCSLKFHSRFTCHCSCTKLNTTTCHCSCTTLNTTCTTLVHCQCTVRSPAPLLALPLLPTLVTQLLLATSVFPSAALSDSTSCPTASTTVAAQPCSHTFSTQTAQRVQQNYSPYFRCHHSKFQLQRNLSLSCSTTSRPTLSPANQ